MVQHDIRAFLLGPKTKKVHHELLVATYLLGPLFAEIAKNLQSRSLDFQGSWFYSCFAFVAPFHILRNLHLRMRKLLRSAWYQPRPECVCATHAFEVFLQGVCWTCVLVCLCVG